MLNTLRRGAKSWVAKILIALLIASFAVWGIGDMFSFRLDDSVAEVGDTKVPAERFADAVRREQTRLSQQAGELVTINTLRQLGIDRRVLAGLVRDAAFTEELDRLGLAAPDAAVARAIREEPAFQGPGGAFSDQAYRLLLAQQGLSPAEFETLTRQIVGRDFLTRAVIGATPRLPGVATRIAAHRGETRDLSQLTLPMELAEEPTKPDEETLRAFYEARPERYTEPERRDIRYIHVDLAKLAEAAEPEEEAVRERYEAERDAFATDPTRTIDRIAYPDEEAAAAALARIEGGESDFEAEAAAVGASADTDLGTVGPDDLPAETAEAVFATAEPGVIGPVPTPLGSWLVRIRSATEGGVRPFEEVRDEIRSRLALDAALARAPEIAAEIEEGRAAGKPLEEIAKGAGLALGQVEGLAQDGTLPGGSGADGIAATDAFLAEAFEAFELEERDMVETPEGGFLLLMVDRVKESALPPFEEVREKVEADWSVDARLAALGKKAAEFVARLGEGETMETLAEEAGVPASSFKGVQRYRDDAELPAALVEQLFDGGEGTAAFARAPAGEETGAGVVLARVDAVHPLDPEALGAATTEIESVLQDSLATDTLEYFGRALEDEHGAYIDQSVLEEVYRLLSGSTGS